MKNFFWILCLVLPILAKGQTNSDLYKYNFQMGDLLYQNHDFPQNIETAISYYKRALALEKTANIYWKLARALWIKQEKEINKATKRKIVLEARVYMKQAIKNYPQNVDIRLWNAIINGTYVRNSGFLESLLFLTEGIKEDLEFVVENRADSARGLVALGAYYYRLPANLGGNLKKAISFFEQSLTADPKFHRANLYLAKAHFKNGQTLLATKNLLAILQSKESEENALLLIFQKEAGTLLKKYQQQTE